MKVSIIIVNYKVKEELLNCISSIYESGSKLNFEIIVVDNDKVKTIEKSLRESFPKVRYVKSKGNTGFGAGINLGAINAKGEYLLILNPDTLFKNNVIDTLTNFLQKNKLAGAISPLLLKKNGMAYDPQGSMELTPMRAIFNMSFISKIFPKNYISNRFWLRNQKNKKIKEVEVCPGTCFMIRKKLFEKIEGFDNSFFLYFEEFDLCKRIKEAGYKMFIHQDAKVIHYLGSSTDKNPESKEIFKKSRFLYFKKNFGFAKALITEFFLRFNKQVLLLGLILVFGLALRTYRLDELMPFIGDQGWYYISARDMLLGREFPLVGITSSHTWLHQGALWTYILAVIFKLFNFNPVAPSYFIALLGTVTIALVYKLAKEMFDERIALVSSFIFATSPLTVLDSRFAYHTSPIPFFTALFLLSIHRWINGNIRYFPLTLFFLGVLYNLEIATFSLAGIVLLILIYGFLRKQKWVLKLFSRKIAALSFIGFIIPMIPMLLYDIDHNFPQTVRVVIWILYRFAVFLGYPPLNSNAPGETWHTFFPFAFDLIQKLIFLPSVGISILLFLLSLGFLIIRIYKDYKSKKNVLSSALILLFVIIPAFAYIAAKTNSSAYLLIFYPQIAIILGLVFGKTYRFKFFNRATIFMITAICLINSYFLINLRFHPGPTFAKQMDAVRKIVNRANGRQYNILGIGEGSKHRSFIMNYEYLTWWLGHGPSDSDQKLKFYVSEYPDRIVVEAKNE